MQSKNYTITRESEPELIKAIKEAESRGCQVIQQGSYQTDNRSSVRIRYWAKLAKN